MGDTDGLESKNNLEVFYNTWKSHKGKVGHKNDINSWTAFFLGFTEVKPDGDFLPTRRAFARAGFPDIDTDFDFENRDDVYAYISHSDKGIYQAKPLLETLNFEYLQTLVWWGKNGYSMQLHRKTWSYRHELILFMQKGDPPALNTGEKGAWYTSVIEAPRPQSNFTEGRCHPTQKPLKLYKTLIYRTPGDVIL
ncbi:hypothetical protein LCGC14_3031520, partial [marine sediment metagenome]